MTRTVTLRVTAEVAEGAQAVVDLLWSRWQPNAKQAFVIVGVGIGDGPTQLKLQATYTARGANSNDGKKKVLSAVDKLGPPAPLSTRRSSAQSRCKHEGRRLLDAERPAAPAGGALLGAASAMRRSADTSSPRWPSSGR